jgi:hypothetical protein
MNLAKSRYSKKGQEWDFSINYATGDMGAITDAERLEPLALKVRGYLAGLDGWRAKIRDICRAIKLPGGRDHPSVAEIIEAGMATRAYEVGDGEAWLPAAPGNLERNGVTAKVQETLAREAAEHAAYEEAADGKLLSALVEQAKLMPKGVPVSVLAADTGEPIPSLKRRVEALAGRKRVARTARAGYWLPVPSVGVTP